MVKRCGFYVRDNKLVRRDVMINWDLGFDKEAKHKYIERIQYALAPLHSVDVTTASPIWKAQHLSPVFVALEDGTKVEDLYSVTKHQGAVEYYYLNALSDKQVDFVLSQECFIDVFHNPDKAFRTQAEALAILKLICSQGSQILKGTLLEFMEYYQNVVNNIVIEEVGL